MVRPFLGNQSCRQGQAIAKTRLVLIIVMWGDVHVKIAGRQYLQIDCRPRLAMDCGGVRCAGL